MGMSLAWAETISFWANWILLASLVVGVAATYGIVISSSVKEDALKSRIAEANARAAEAQLALEQYKAPRSLSLEAALRIEEKIAKYSGVPFTVSVNPNPEPIAFMSRIAEILETAGWKWQPWKGTTGVTLLSHGKPDSGVLTRFSGLAIEFDEEKADMWKTPALILANALGDEGFKVTVNTALKGSAPPDSIQVLVGTKP